MPVELATPIDTPVAPNSPVIYPPRKRWTRAEYEAIDALGLWNEDRLELIEGELITKMSKNRPHILVFMYVMKWLVGLMDPLYLSLEAGIDVAPEDNPTSEPEPDIAVLEKLASEYIGSNPPASDIQLVIEISDSTLAFDLGPKARIYARASILDYWVFDIAGRRLIVHREPRDGSYSSVSAYVEGETVAPLSMPSASFPVATAFPFPAVNIQNP